MKVPDLSHLSADQLVLAQAGLAKMAQKDPELLDDLTDRQLSEGLKTLREMETGIMTDTLPYFIVRERLEDHGIFFDYVRVGEDGELDLREIRHPGLSVIGEADASAYALQAERKFGGSFVVVPGRGCSRTDTFVNDRETNIYQMEPSGANITHELRLQ